MRDAVILTYISLFARENLLYLLVIKTKCKSYIYCVKDKSLHLTHVKVIPVFTFCLLYDKSFNLCGRKLPNIPFHTRRTIIKLSQAGNNQRKRVKYLSVSHTIVQSIIKKFQNTGFV